MFLRDSLIRSVAVPVCVAWAVVEFLALQRAHFGQRRRQPATQVQTAPRH